MAKALIEAIPRPDMPLPIVAAGSDGSIEIVWRRNPQRELSCFIESDDMIALLSRDGRVFEKSLGNNPPLINTYVRELFD